MWLMLTDDRRVLRTAAAPPTARNFWVSALGFTELREPHCHPLVIHTPDDLRVLGKREVLLS